MASETFTFVHEINGFSMKVNNQVSRAICVAAPANICRGRHADSPGDEVGGGGSRLGEVGRGIFFVGGL